MRTSVKRVLVVAALIAAQCVGVAVTTTVATAATTASSSQAKASSATVAAAAAPGGSFVKLAPTRVLDTRTGLGAPSAAVASHASVSVTLAGTNGIPATVASSIELTVMVSSPTAAGDLVAYKTGSAVPGTSSVSFSAGQTTANTVLVTVGTGGKVSFYNSSSGTVQVTADLIGYYTAGAPTLPGMFGAVTPTRLLDTAHAIGVSTTTPVAAHATVLVQVTGHAGVPSGAAIAVLNLGATAPTASGAVVAYPTGTAAPAMTHLALTAGLRTSNLAIVRLSSAGAVTLWNNSAGTVALTADVVGYVTAGSAAATGSFFKLAAARLIDTRTGVGAPATAIAAGATLTVQVTGRVGVPVNGVTAVVINVNALQSTASGFLTAYPAGSAQPTAQQANFTTNKTNAALVESRVSTSGQLSIYNGSSGTVQVMADIVGYDVHDFTWGTATSVDPARGQPSAISCVGTTFCAAVDSHGDWAKYNGTSWSSPAAADSNRGLTSVSCRSTTFCVAVDGTGHAVIYNGTSWSAPVTIDANLGLTSVSCSSVTACIAVDDTGHAAKFNGSSWTAPAVVASGQNLAGVSCASSSYCVAVGGSDEGYAVRYNGTSWSSPADVDPASGGLTAVSCPTTSFCVAVDAGGGAVTLHTTTWSAPVVGDAAQTLTSISCTSTTFCVAGDFFGNVVRFNGASWTAPASVLPHDSDLGFARLSVSCTASTLCLAVEDVAGNAAKFTGTAWSSPVNIDPRQGAPRSVSCLSATSCVLVGGGTNGDAATFNGTSWTTPVNVDGAAAHFGLDLTSVSCPKTTFCAAVDDAGNATTFNGSTWSALVSIDPALNDVGFALTSVSCPTTTFCLALDFTGKAFTFNGSTWSAGVQVASGASGAAVACPSSTFCEVVGTTGSGDGYAARYNGSTFSAPVVIDAGHAPTSISCPATTFCAVVDDSGRAVRFNGTSWTAPASILGSEFVPAVSCASSFFCVAVDDLGNAARFDGTNWGPATAVFGTAVTPSAVSCPTDSFCAVTESSGSVVIGTR